ncbi:Uncharacterised protein [uncultured archaeon]|nr:Uncharacterised protein [uncultured archaeon]
MASYNDPKKVRKDNIWLYAQNKPSLIIKDLEKYGVPAEDALQILLARGVCKWLAARRDLIHTKDAWKEQIRQCHEEILKLKGAGDFKALNKARGRLEALNVCRQQVRAICKSERWRVPDFDGKAAELLKRLEK